MSFLQLYLLTRFGAIQSAALPIAVVSGTLAGFMGFFYMMEYGASGDDDRQAAFLRKACKKMVIAFSISAMLLILVPSKKDMAIILGGYWVSNSEEVQKLPNNVVKTINDFLEKYQGQDPKEPK